jgi:hypothetical protein
MTYHVFNKSVASCWSIEVNSYLRLKLEKYGHDVYSESETAHYLQPSTCEEFQTAMRDEEYLMSAKCGAVETFRMWAAGCQIDWRYNCNGLTDWSQRILLDVRRTSFCPWTDDKMFTISTQQCQWNRRYGTVNAQVSQQSAENWFEKLQYELWSHQCSNEWLIEIVLHSMQQTDHKEFVLGSSFRI